MKGFLLLLGLTSLELIIENVTWSDRNIYYSSRLTEWADQLNRLRLICMFQCFNKESSKGSREKILNKKFIYFYIFYIYF